MLFSVIARTRVLHPENMAVKGPVLLASNHISHFDPPVLTRIFGRKIDWLAMAELFQHPVAAWYFRKVDAFPADRFNHDPLAVRTALKRLSMGRVVGIFPEGGLRSGPTSMLEGAEIQPGAASLAMMAGVPILPCALVGSDRFYDPKCLRRWRSVPLYVNFGQPLLPKPDLPKSKARQELSQRLGETIRSLYCELKTVFHLRPEDLPATAQRRKGREEPPLATLDRL